MLTTEQLSEEEKIILEVIESARVLEEFLWGEHNSNWGLEEWKRMFNKRSVKFNDINPSNPHWQIEARKRLLQNAALSVAMIRLLNENKIGSGISSTGTPSNLEQYK
jgi:hypothetical protein